MVTSDTFHGVALVDLDTDEVRPVDGFAEDRYDAGGMYDGDLLVWKEYHRLLDDFVVKQWSAQTGVVRVVGRSHRDPKHGGVFATVWSDPVLADGHAAWVEGTGRPPRGQVVVLDAASGRTRVVGRGHPAGVVIHGDHVVWRDGADVDGPHTTHAATWDGRRTAPPAALSGHPENLTAVSDGRAIGWIEGDGERNELYYSPDGVRAARPILTTAPGGFDLAMLRGKVVTDTQAGLVVVQSDGTWATLVAGGGGSVSVGGGGFLVSEPNLKRTRVPPPGLALLDPGALDLPACE